MDGYAFSVRCLECDGPLVHVNSSHPSRQEACAIARCSICGLEHSIHVQLCLLGRNWSKGRRVDLTGVS